MDYTTKLQEIYAQCLGAGLCRNKGEFAQLLGIDQSHLSHVLKGDGKFSARNLCEKAQAIVNNKVSNGSAVQIGDGNTNGIPPKKFENESEWFALVREKDKQIDRLLSIIEKIQG